MRTGDLLSACDLRLRTQVEAAINILSQFFQPKVGECYISAIRLATATCVDSPGARAWTQSILSSAGFLRFEDAAPSHEGMGHIVLDHPSLSRLAEILSWQIIGSCINEHRTITLSLPSPPPNLLAIGEWGAFRVPDERSSEGTWSLRIDGSEVRLSGPHFEAVSSASDPHWKGNVVLQGPHLNVSVPLHTPSLMNPAFQDFLMVRSTAYAHVWGERLLTASALLHNYSAKASGLVRALVKCAVPLMDGRDSIGSASREGALGLVFLPGDCAQDQLVECLLHEAMHQLLFRLEECGEIFEAGTTEEAIFYSPWRHDPRPLRMLLHGAFVFTCVADLYRSEKAAEGLRLSNEECARRSFYRASQSRLALDVLKTHARMTRLGKTIFAATEADLAGILASNSSSRDDRDSLNHLMTDHRAQHASFVG